MRRAERTADIRIPVIIHGITGRMGDVAHRALKELAVAGIRIGDDLATPVPIGLGRDADRLSAYASETGLAESFTNLEAALGRAADINPSYRIYHNAVSTGVRHAAMLEALPLLDPSTTAVFCEKPIAANYKQGREIMAALERGRFTHGVVHDILETSGVRKAIEIIPKIEPVSCRMVFGYEVGDGKSGNPDFTGQRPDFNWLLSEAGGGITLDMCHESYLSRALFGATDRLSAVARLLVPERVSAQTGETLSCDVEDYVSIRREHAGGVINNSTWSWFQRVNSEFGPLEITVDGLEGSIVFGLHGLKVQWKESAPALRWKDVLNGTPVAWRDFWQYPEIEKRNPFAVELERFIKCLVRREPYPYDATVALDWLGEVEAIYSSAARGGEPVSHAEFLHYPDTVADDWAPQRLQGLL